MIAAAPAPLDATLCPYAETTIHHKARRLIGRFGFTVSDLPDLEQELALDLLKRAAAFDPAKARWSTFLSRCIDHRIADIIRARCASKRDPERLSQLADGTAGDNAVCARPTDDAVDLRLDLSAVLARLPGGLRQLCLRLTTASVSTIAAEDGRSRWHVYQDIARIRAAFVTAGLTAYC